MGKRTADEHWDAYEAPDGVAYLRSHDTAGAPDDPLERRTPWAITKHRLIDLANELAAGSSDGTMPVLGIDRLWLRGDGRLLLLDFPAPGAATSRAERTDASTPVGLLTAVASAASDAAGGPEREPLRSRPGNCSRAGLGADPHDAGAALIAVPAFMRFMDPQNMRMLGWLERVEEPPEPGSRLSDPAIRDAAERYVVGRYGAALRDDSFWSMAAAQGASPGCDRHGSRRHGIRPFRRRN